MEINLKKTYKFAVKSALFISLFSCALGLLFIIFLFDVSLQKALIFGSLFFIFNYLFSFIVLQYRVEKFIYRRVKKIYDEVFIKYKEGSVGYIELIDAQTQYTHIRLQHLLAQNNAWMKWAEYVYAAALYPIQ